MRWAEGGSCRHDAILRYFGDEEETLEGCGQCDVCLSLAQGETADLAGLDTTVRKALSAVARVHGRFGLQAAARLLKGTSDPRLERAGLHTTRTFGALSERSEEWLTKLLRRCVTAGWVDFHGAEHPVVVLTEEGKAVLFAERPVRLLLPTSESATAPRLPAGGKRRASAGPELDADARGRFDALRRHRLELAREAGVPPYVVASDRTLREIAERQPRTLAELEEVHGIGPAKAAKYGAGLIKAVSGKR
jgi:ATP-dependent DNA helicase RecQ